MTREQIANAANLYEAGWSIGFVAKQFGVAKSTILKYFHEDGVEVRPKIESNIGSDFDHKAMEQTLFLYKHVGKSLPEIAEITEVGIGTVRRRLQIAGVLPKRSLKKKTSLRRAA